MQQKIINYEKKRNHTINKEKKRKCIISKKFVIYAKKDLVLMIAIKKYHKIRNHCHYTGKYRGAAPNTSNLRYKNTK